MTGWKGFASIYEGGVLDTSVVVFIPAAPEEVLSASFAAEVSPCKKVTTVFANVLKANETFAKVLRFIRNGAFYTEQ